MNILRNIKVPTGNIMIVKGDKGKLECLSIGDYGKEANLKADFMGLTREIDHVEHQEIRPEFVAVRVAGAVLDDAGVAGLVVLKNPVLELGDQGGVVAGNAGHQVAAHLVGVILLRQGGHIGEELEMEIQGGRCNKHPQKADPPLIQAAA